MVTIQDWIEYLKRSEEGVHEDRNYNQRSVFAVASVLIGSILAVANGIYATNWSIVVLGFAGIFLFGYLLYVALQTTSFLLYCAREMSTLLSRIMLDEFPNTDEIAEEYKRIGKELQKKFKNQYTS
jgi:hypothetical protein